MPRKVTPPRVDSVATTGQATARLRTNLGLLTLTLDRVAAPCTVNNFLELARQGYYDGTDCHRLVTRQLYVLQCGDPGGTGTGGPGYTFPDENLPSDTTTPVTFPAGTIAMANAGPDTNGSQFFIVYQEFQLPPTYTIFGKLTTGMAVVEGVAAVGSDPSEDGRPKKPISIKSINLSD